ncbi:hypothetical protein [Chromobacterium sp. IIBBL 290-4]|uniref:hypothetical protein n=1 Tax=Chromobacterium sp. IIBBL 290-4 TaxID=2953890 RepID=UPI0020B88AA7|nr:hypothetical protein [Chromobacterium sp. IIBBL 290-4]UTH72681.1 hypothetical protein NKT35_14155 [Chromobacterium sp. IIBBL 290-4]
MQKALLILCLLVTFGSHAEEPAKTDDSARIRIFQRNGVGLGVFPRQSCYQFNLFGKDGNIVESQSFSSFLHMASNKSISMPETANLRAMPQVSKLFSSVYFEEYRLPARQVATITSSFNDATYWHCKTLAVRFTPQAGRDYEAMLDVDMDNKTCKLIVGTIPQNAPDAALEPPSDLSRAASCSEQK